MFFTPDDWEEYEMEMERFREEQEDLFKRMLEKGLELQEQLPDGRIEVSLKLYEPMKHLISKANEGLDLSGYIENQLHKKFISNFYSPLNELEHDDFLKMLYFGVKLKTEFNENSLNKIAKDLENIDDSNNERKLQLCDWKKEDYYLLMHMAVLINDKGWFDELSLKLNEVS